MFLLRTWNWKLGVPDQQMPQQRSAILKSKPGHDRGRLWPHTTHSHHPKLDHFRLALNHMDGRLWFTYGFVDAKLAHTFMYLKKLDMLDQQLLDPEVQCCGHRLAFERPRFPTFTSPAHWMRNKAGLRLGWKFASWHIKSLLHVWLQSKLWSILVVHEHISRLKCWTDNSPFCLMKSDRFATLFPLGIG